MYTGLLVALLLLIFVDEVDVHYRTDCSWICVSLNLRSDGLRLFVLGLGSSGVHTVMTGTVRLHVLQLVSLGLCCISSSSFFF